MEILINIPEERYKNIKEQVDKKDYPDMQTGRAIADGTIIPEGHGRCVTKQSVLKAYKNSRFAIPSHKLKVHVKSKEIPEWIDLFK